MNLQSENMGKRARKLLGAVMVALSVTLVAGIATTPTTASALTTSKATARPNEDGGDSVIGGIDTRLTWEGTVDEGETVSSVTLVVPEDGSFDGSTPRVTVLEGLKRLSLDSTATASGNQITIDFAEPVPAGSLLRLEITNMKFPTAGGDYSISGSYVSDAGTKDLADSPKIAITANTPLQSLVTWLDNQAWVEAWNSNQFLGMFFKPQLLVTSMVSLFSGWLLCIAIVLFAYPFAILLGLGFSFLKMSKNPVARGIAAVYINILRGTPLFLQIYIMFFGLPMLNINIDNNVLGVIVMAVNSSAYLAEIFRAGIESIPNGQYEAAASLGMNKAQTMVSVILPQTVRRVLPTITSDFITGFKDTSLLSSVGVMELMMFSKNLTTTSGNITPYMAAAIYYLIITLPLIKVVTIVERRLAAAESGAGPRPKGKGRNKETAASPSLEPTVGGVHMQATEPEKKSAWALAMSPFRPQTTMGGVSDAE